MPLPSRPGWFPDLRGPHITDRVCFLHVPKCAGISVARSMRHKYRLSDHLRGRLTSIAAAPSSFAAQLQGEDLIDYRKAVLAYFLARDDLLFVTGHVGCTGTIVDAFADKWKFVTVLRDPVERFMSEYFYNRYKESDHFATRLSLEEYLDDSSGRISARTYINLFSGLPNAAPDDERVEDAFANLERFALVGFVDAMDDFRNRFAAITGVPIAEGRTNTNPAPGYESRRTPPPELRTRIETMCAPDIEIYRRARAAAWS